MPRYTIQALRCCTRRSPSLIAAPLSFFLMILGVTLSFTGDAQEKGVHFEHALSWTDIKAKAKAENKYIFVDCFTTWCGPCRYMRTVIFPQEEAGHFFNDKFVNVEVQLDTTAKDDDHVKSWYADAHAIMTKYRIKAFPTYLIFAPNGRVLHRIVGSSASAKTFIDEVQESFDTTKQYYTKLEQFEKGRRDSGFLRQLAIQVGDAYDIPLGLKIAKAYMAGQRNLFTPAALNLMNMYIMRSTDEYFAFFAKHASEVDRVMGARKAEDKIREVFLFENRVRMRSKGSPDWNGIQKKIAATLPAEAQEITMRIKIEYYSSKNDWPNFEKTMVTYMKKYSQHMNNDELNSIAWDVFEHCTDMTCVSQILDWSKRLKNSKIPGHVDTYANIMYKLGKKDEAISLEQKAIDMSPENERPDYRSTLDKMKKGQKTWD